MDIVSDCCGAFVTAEGMDYGICPDCGEHCEWIDLSDEEDHIGL